MARKGTRLLLWISAIGLLILVAATVALVFLLGEGAPGFDSEPQWLHVKPGLSLADAPGNEGLVMDPADMPPLTTELSAAIVAAAGDDSIAGVFLEPSALPIGWAQTTELRDALSRFEAAGKPCVAWSGGYDNRSYYLASACGEVLLAPAGATTVSGLAVTQTYFAGAFEKLGIKANFEHVGEFKSGPEPYQRSGPSPESAEAMDVLLDGLFDNFLVGIADGRGISVDEARALVDDPPMTPDEAVARKLVDGLAYRDELTHERFDDKLLKSNKYLKDLRRRWARGSKSIAVVHVEGAIVDGKSGQELFGGAFVGDASFRKLMEVVREDDDVVAVVLRVNSPGGSGSASDAMHREVALTRDKKPVVVSMSDYAASGGYYISMGADHIVAQPDTLTGSIGVFGGKLNLAGLLDKGGVTTHTWKRGEYSTLFSSMSDFDDNERAKFQGFLQSFYDLFVSKAAEGRHMSVEELHEVARGRVWTGRQALDRGLVDELGGLDLAIDKAAELAQIDRDTVGVVRFPERKSFFDALFEEIGDPDAGASDEARAALQAALPSPDLRRLADSANTLHRVLATSGVAAMLPGALEVH